MVAHPTASSSGPDLELETRGHFLPAYEQLVNNNLRNLAALEANTLPPTPPPPPPPPAALPTSTPRRRRMRWSCAKPGPIFVEIIVYLILACTIAYLIVYWVLLMIDFANDESDSSSSSTTYASPSIFASSATPTLLSRLFPPIPMPPPSQEPPCTLITVSGEFFCVCQDTPDFLPASALACASRLPTSFATVTITSSPFASNVGSEPAATTYGVAHSEESSSIGAVMTTSRTIQTGVPQPPAKTLSPVVGFCGVKGESCGRI